MGEKPKHIICGLILLGITLVYFPADQLGYVTYNDTPHHHTIIVRKDVATKYSSDGTVDSAGARTAGEFSLVPLWGSKVESVAGLRSVIVPWDKLDDKTKAKIIEIYKSVPK